MKALIKKIISYLLSLWNIYAGLILSTFISFLVKWTSAKMDTATSYILLSITCITVFTYIKKTLNRKKHKKEKKGIINAVTTTADTGIVKLNNTTNRLNTLDSIETNGEVIGSAIVNTIEIADKIGGKSMKAIRKTFKWLWTYRQQVIGLIGALFMATVSVYGIVLDKFGFITKYAPNTFGWQLGIKIGAGVIALFIVYYLIRNQVKWVGVGSLQTATEYLDSLNKVISSGTKLSATTKKTIRNMLEIVKGALKQAEKTCKTCKTKYSNFLFDFNNQKELISALSMAGVTGSVLTDAQTKLNDIQIALNTAKSDLDNAETEVKRLSTQIEAYEKALNE